MESTDDQRYLEDQEARNEEEVDTTPDAFAPISRCPDFILFFLRFLATYGFQALSFVFYFFGIYFLVKDRKKGGSCAHSYEVEVFWYYCLSFLISCFLIGIYVASTYILTLKIARDAYLALDLAERQKQETRKKIQEMVFKWKFIYDLPVYLVIMGFFVFASFAVFYHTPCDGFQRTGLWIWGLISYATLFVSILIIFAGVIRIYKQGETEPLPSNTRTAV